MSHLQHYKDLFFAEQCVVVKFGAEIERLTAELKLYRTGEAYSLAADRIAVLEAALRPFAKAHGQESPSLSLTLHDLRMAHQALQEDD